jgi:hypothetical protein
MLVRFGTRVRVSHNTRLDPGFLFGDATSVPGRRQHFLIHQHAWDGPQHIVPG